MGKHEHQSTGWQLEQNASEAYEQFLVPPIFASWADRLVETGDIETGDRVLDVACGTGIVARRAASRVGPDGSVVGLDINDGMLAVAAETSTGIEPQIDWRQADVADLPYPDEHFDAVLCQQALQFFDDPNVAVEEMRRVLTPGGHVALSVWRPLGYHPAYVVLAEALEQHIGSKAGDMMRSPFPEWDGDDLRSIVEEASFENVNIIIEIGSVRYPSVEEFIRREAASSPLAEPIGAMDGNVQRKMVQDVEEGLGEYTDDKGVISPMESYVIFSRR